MKGLPMQQIAPFRTGFSDAGDAAQIARSPSVINLAELPGILWRRRRMIVAAAALTLTMALLFSLLSSPSYIASVRLLIDPRGLQVIDRELTPRAPASEINLAVVESQMRVLSSDGVFRSVIENLKLRDDTEFTGKSGIRAQVRSLIPLLAKKEAADPSNEVLTELRKVIKAERLQNSFIVDVFVTTQDAEKSARIANEIAAVYTSSETSNRESLAMRTSDSLTGRLTELKNKVRAAEEAVERYKRQNNIVITGGTTGSSTGSSTINGTAGALFSDQELAQLNQQLSQVRTLAAQSAARADQIERVLRSGASPDSIAEAVQSPTIAQLRVRLSMAQQQFAALAVDLLPSHPSMVAARARVADAASQIRSELDRIARAARADLERARASERELSASLDRAKRERSITDQARVQLRELEREADASRTIYESFLVRAREIGEQKSVDPTNARVISPAIAPNDPKGLRTSLLLPLALFAGLALGTLLALAREHLDPIVRTGRQIENAVRLPVLAELPIVSSRTAHHGLEDLFTGGPNGPAARSMRQLRASLPSAGALGGPRRVLVTAVGDQTGKSTLALNLALAAAANGEHVLLVDGDLIDRQLTSSRMPHAKLSLADVLDDRAKLEDAVLLDPSGLVLMLASTSRGKEPSRVSEPAIHRLLREKCQNFDLVVIDGGRIGQDNLSNIYSSAVDDIVPVARCNSTRKEEITAAISRLGANAEKVRGIAMIAG
jgi:polysaccharide biosynthesis transport protein